MSSEVRKFSVSTQTTAAFVSCDKRVFHVEREDLDRMTHFMPPPNAFIPPAPPPKLLEDSYTLELLFRFVNSEEDIDLDRPSFSTVAALAEAAQKYQVYSATTVCRQYMKSQAKAHPVEVMQYAAKHDFRDILDAVAPYTVGTAVATMQEILPDHYLIPWVLFNDAHQQAMQAMVKGQFDKEVLHVTQENMKYYWTDPEEVWFPPPKEACGLGDKQQATWDAIHKRIMYALVSTGGQLDIFGALSVKDDMFARLESCPYCYTRLFEWREYAWRVIDNKIRDFTSLL